MSDWTEEERRVTCAGCEAIVSPHTSRPYCASCLEARTLAHVEAAKHIMRLMAERDRALALLRTVRDEVRLIEYQELAAEIDALLEDR